MAHIFVADDDPLVVDLLSFRLRRHGHQVDSAGDGEAALDALLKGRHDLLIADYQLPVLSCSELIKAMRAAPHTRQTPIIVLSSGWREQDVLAALEAGVADFMTKPLSLGELLLRVELALKKATAKVLA